MNRCRLEDDSAIFASTITVGPTGTINVPRIGEIKANGLMAAEEAAHACKTGLSWENLYPTAVIINPVQAVRGLRDTLDPLPKHTTCHSPTPGWGEESAIARWTAIDAYHLTLASGRALNMAMVTAYQSSGKGELCGVYKLKEIGQRSGKNQKLRPADQGSVRALEPLGPAWRLFNRNARKGAMIPPSETA